MTSGPESVVKRWVRGWIKRTYGNNAWVHNAHQGRYGHVGCPDLLCCIHGIFVAIELKANNGTLRPKQKLELTKIADAKGIAIVVKGKDHEILESTATIISILKSTIHSSFIRQNYLWEGYLRGEGLQRRSPRKLPCASGQRED